MWKKNVIFIMIIICIISLFFVIINKKDCNKSLCKCNPVDSNNIIYGEIVDVNHNRLLIKTIENQNWIVRHKLDVKFKVGQTIKVEHAGPIDQSNPPLVTSVCIELIK